MTWELVLLLGAALIIAYLYYKRKMVSGPYTGTTFSANPIPDWMYRYGA